MMVCNALENDSKQSVYGLSGAVGPNDEGQRSITNHRRCIVRIETSNPFYQYLMQRSKKRKWAETYLALSTQAMTKTLETVVPQIDNFTRV